MGPRILALPVLRKLAALTLIGFDSHAQLTEQQKSLQDYYNTTYRENEDEVFNPAPSEFLVDVVSALKPGRALDVGMGPGRNTIFLAQRGWMVTGVDI